MQPVSLAAILWSLLYDSAEVSSGLQSNQLISVSVIEHVLGINHQPHAMFSPPGFFRVLGVTWMIKVPSLGASAMLAQAERSSTPFSRG